MSVVMNKNSEHNIGLHPIVSLAETMGFPSQKYYYHCKSVDTECVTRQNQARVSLVKKLDIFSKFRT